jgi:succinoglycan biosynthesis protein ExoM
LRYQETDGRFTFSVIVVDNDRLRSAENTVCDAAFGSPIPVYYYLEERQSIALARNKAIENAAGDFVVFIDDDEFPTTKWLLTLFTACNEHGVDGVLGPVKPHFAEQPPDWLVRGGFYNRPAYPTGLVIDAKQGRTGNVLLKNCLFETAGVQPFRPQFRTGEDQDFFRRMIEKGYVFIWCNEALAYETVPPVRWKRSFLLRRALLRGADSVEHPTFGLREITKSLIAVPVYTASLPLALALGHDKFMVLLVSLFDHAGRLLALLGIDLIKEQYVTE